MGIGGRWSITLTNPSSFYVEYWSATENITGTYTYAGNANVAITASGFGAPPQWLYSTAAGTLTVTAGSPTITGSGIVPAYTPFPDYPP